MAVEGVATAVCRVRARLTSEWHHRIGHPEQFRLAEFVRRHVAAFHDPRKVISDPRGGYYGIQVSERSLVPDNDAQLGETRFEDWLIHATKQAAKAGRQPE